MSISTAYSLFRSSSSADTYALAQRLCELMSWQGPTVRLGAELRTVEDVLRMVDVLPNALYLAEGVPFDPVRRTDEYRADALPTDRGEFEALLPFILDVDMPVGELEENFVRALGAGPATIDWEGHWPDVPELGLLAAPKYEGVQAVFNSDDVGWERPSQDHTVFVHLRRDLPRAEWLAGQVGARVLGEPETGW
ncbi:hypothetical protein OG830_13170 [Streptomyces sp. NBC_00121]|uniref:hypothetical protein n=1 Tax=unclassified Streptomyces TaxID=2593676 RepID=UPI002DDAFDE4|nr:hypothetical protein [Streptomyces sp. NBC_01760]WSC69329.1 hypothetical protein OG807_13195 [Streptomyces sp. NBC_01760]